MGGTWLDRVISERDELKMKLDALDRFRAGRQPLSVNNNQWALMHSQREAMRDYLSILNARIDDAGKSDGQ